MEEGKYISLGNSIQIRLSTKGLYTYYHSYRDDNQKVKRVKLFTSKKQNSTNFKRAIIQSELPPEIKKLSKKTTTLNSLADKYFKSRYKKKIIKLGQEYNDLSEKQFKESKIIKQRLASLKIERQKYAKNVSNSDMANIDVYKMTKANIDDYTYEYLPKFKLSEASCYNMVNMIKTIFNYAIRNDLMTILSPFAAITYDKPEKKKRRALNVKELTTLLKACKEHQNPNVYLAVYLGVLTAARSKMILSIRKKDIDIINEEIRLSNFKSNNTYTIKLNTKSINWLNEKVLKHINSDDYLIRSTNLNYLPDTPQPMSEMPQAIFEIMDELFNSHLNKRSNRDRENVINFHSLRRSIATNLANQGTTLYDIMVLLDHKSIKQTEDYLSLSNKNLAKQTDKLNFSIFENTKFELPDIDF